MWIYIKSFKIKNIYFLHFKFVSHLGYYNPNGLLYPIWEIGPNLLKIKEESVYVLTISEICRTNRWEWVYKYKTP
jgi:hypothetical protein